MNGARVTPIVSAVALLLLAGCTASEDILTIQDAVDAGFIKGDQQVYQMVDARDGWGGEWVGEVVELYEYKDAETAREGSKHFDAAVQPDNVSGWVERCVVLNLVMLSKGNKACEELQSLA